MKATKPNIIIWLIILLSLSSCSAQKNQPKKNEYGVTVITGKQQYKATVKHSKSKAFVLLRDSIPNIATDLKYATANNFTKQILYKNADAYLRKPAASALQKVAAELKSKNIGIKIFDAYRPYSVTVKMWALVKDENYTANPAKGSGHNRGAAVDITLIDLATGKELTMPTPFDDFTEKAGHHYTDLPDSILQNRKLLKTTMEKYGFVALRTEWWHYTLPNAAQQFELMDIDFDEMKKLVK